MGDVRASCVPYACHVCHPMRAVCVSYSSRLCAVCVPCACRMRAVCVLLALLILRIVSNEPMRLLSFRCLVTCLRATFLLAGMRALSVLCTGHVIVWLGFSKGAAQIMRLICVPCACVIMFRRSCFMFWRER